MSEDRTAPVQVLEQLIRCSGEVRGEWRGPGGNCADWGSPVSDTQAAVGGMEVDAWVQWWHNNALAVGVGLGVALLTCLIYAIYVWWRRPSESERLAHAAQAAAARQKMDAATLEAALEWAPRQLALAERRASVRRSGAPVRVTVASPLFQRGVTDGFVLDRSTGGLCIALATEVPRGAVLKVRAVHAPDTVGYVNVIVRNCRRQEEYYEVGCEFEQTPPWNVLLLFG